MTQEMQAILEDSAASMEGTAAGPQSQQARRAWWSQRVSLDHRLAALLARLQYDSQEHAAN